MAAAASPAGCLATFTAAIIPYLRGGVIPTCPTAGENSGVKVSGGQLPIAGETTAGQKSWHYCSGTGQFICNSDADTLSDPDVRYDEL